MKRDIFWLTTISMVIGGIYFVPDMPWHDAYLIIVSFFFLQTLGLMSLDHIVPKEWSAQVSMIKIILSG